MRIQPRSWNAIFTKLGFRSFQSRSPQKAYKYKAKLGIEPLENRRLLAAVGTFERFDANGEDPEVTAGYTLYAQTYDNYPNSPLEDSLDVGNDLDAGEDAEILARAGNVVTLNSGSQLASGTGHALADLLTPIGISTVTPLTTQVAGQLAASSVTDYGWARSDSRSSTTLHGGFDFEGSDPPYTSYRFTGYIYLVGVGLGTANGDNGAGSHWSHDAAMGISVTVCGQEEEVARLWANHSAFTSSPDPSSSTGNWVIGGFTTDEDDNVYVINPDGDTANGVNLLVTFTADLAPGCDVVFNSLYDVDGPGPFWPGINAGTDDPVDFEHVDAFGSGGNAQHNFVQGIYAWGHAEPTGPLVLPPFIEEFPLPGPGGTDFDGDGDADNDDIIAFVEDTLRSSEDGPNDSRMGDWIDSLIAQSQGDAIVVTTEDDELDANYDDSLSDLSLREALDLANNRIGDDTILFAPWVHDIHLDEGQLAVSSNVDIIGPGSDLLTLNADGLSRVLSLSAGVEATIEGLTVTGGLADHGAGIYNAGDLTLIDVAVVGNVANTSSSQGGGIYVGNGSTGGASLHLADSTVDGNQAIHGNGIYAYLVEATLSIERSTISKNFANDSAVYSAGGGLAIASSSNSAVNISNSTFSGNSALYSGGIRLHNSLAATSIVNTTIAYNTGNESGGLHVLNTSTAPTLHNSIIAENEDHSSIAKDSVGSIASASSYNLFGRGGSSGKTDNDATFNLVLTSTENAGLAPLGDYGGKTKTHALKDASQALNNANDSLAPASDQRGALRPIGVGDASVSDIGAFEAGDFTTLTVRTLVDRRNPIDPNDLSLREAIQFTTALAGSELILFDPALFETGLGEITLSYDSPYDADSLIDPLTLYTNVRIRGPGADHLIISGDRKTRPFEIVEGVAVIEGLTVTKGLAASGGGILVRQSGVLTIDRVRVVNNEASEAGGGVATQDQASLIVLNSEIAQNTLTGSTGSGAGIHFAGGAEANARLQIVNSTISGNIAYGAASVGGGIAAANPTIDYSTEVLISNTTIAFNEAATGGGVFTYEDGEESFGLMEVHNTIISKNVDSSDVASDISGSLSAASSYNILGVGDMGSLSNGVAGNKIGIDPRLMSLAFNGGATRSHSLWWDSPAIDAGDDALALYDFDQRGFDRIEDWKTSTSDDIDIGAIELAFHEYFY